MPFLSESDEEHSEPAWGTSDLFGLSGEEAPASVTSGAICAMHPAARLEDQFWSFLDRPLLVGGQSAAVDQSMNFAPWAIRWLTWPLLSAACITLAWTAISFRFNLAVAATVISLGTTLALFALELIYPHSVNSAVTYRTLLGRDFKFVLATFVARVPVKFILQWVPLRLSASGDSLGTRWPLWVSVLLILLVAELTTYWRHRWAHANNSPVTKFMWKLHVAHHLPQQVYVLMCQVVNPLESLVAVPMLIGVLLGGSPTAVFLVGAIYSLHIHVQHANVDLRAGWLNYAIAGPELHRWHHSADLREAQNFAVLFSFIDIVFGTFVYWRSAQPATYGVQDASLYPRSTQFWRVVTIPFHLRSR